MADVIDDLKVQIDASTNSADAKIDKFIQKMLSLQSAISGIEMSGASQVASGINQIASSIQSFNERTKTADFSRVTGGLNKLAAVDVQGVSNTAHAMEIFANSISGIGNLKFDTDTLTNIANSISKLGRSSVTEATQNLEFLKTSMADFVSGMNNVGSLNFNPDALYKLVSSISRLGGKNSTQLVKNLPQISNHLHGFVTSMNSIGSVTFNIEGLSALVNNISRLGGAKATQAATNLKPIKDQILRFVSGLNGIGALNFDTVGLENLVSSISKLGNKAAGNAIPNIQGLGIALKDMMQTLSGAPKINNNLIQMTNALANLASSGSKVSSASQAMKNGLNSYSNSAGRAKDSTKSLASQLGMLYAKYFMLVRGVKGLWKATESSMDYIETLNYFDAAWGQVADNAVGSWKQSGYDSAEAYANSFSERAKELTGKMSGFQADSNGNLVSTGALSLGIDPDMLMNYQATFGQMASSMDVASETALQLSNALTMIGADLASVRNMDFKDVWENLASGMVGMSETVDKYGVNIREANLQQKLSELGIKAKISALNQQDKVLLRTMIILDSTRYAWGDLANTLEQPSNQLRLLQSNFSNLARTIGNIFLPIVAAVLPYVNALVIAVQRLFSWIGNLLGVKVGSLVASTGAAATDMNGLEDAAGGVADKMDDAAKKSKKMASNLQSFDNLNVISSNDGSSGKGGGGKAGTSGLLDDAFLNAFSEYQKAWDDAFSNMENSAQKMADQIQDAFQKIWDIAEPTRDAMKRLWIEGFKEFGEFSTDTLKDFYNNFLVPVGTWTLGEDGLARFLNITNSMLKDINWSKLRTSLSDFYKELSRLTILSFTSMLDFYDDFLKPIAVWGIGNGLPRLLDVMTNLSKKIKWEQFVDALDDVYKALSHLTVGIGNGLIAFVEGLARLLTPVLSGLVSGLSLVLKGFSSVISAIPEDTLVFLTGAVAGFLTTFITYQTVVTAIDAIKTGITGLYVVLDDFFIKAIGWVAANPYVALAAGLAAIAGGLIAMNQNWKKKMADEFSEFQDKIGSNTDSLNEAADSFSNVAESSQKVIESAEQDSEKLGALTEAYFNLADQSSLTSSEQDKLKNYAQQLIDKVPELQGMIDKTTGRYTAQRDEIQKVIEKQQEYYQVMAYQKVVEEYGAALSEANVQLAISEKQYGNNEKKMKTLQDAMDSLTGSYEDQNVWYSQNKDLLDKYGISLDSNKSIAQQLAQQIAFYEQELGKSTEAQNNAKKAVEDASLAYNTANEVLDGHKQKYKELEDTVNSMNFGKVTIDASKAIDDLGGIFVDGKQIVGEAAIELYQSIIEAYGNTDQDMYDLGEKGVVQFGQGGMNGVPEAVSTMNDELWAKVKADYESKGYQVSYDGGKLLVKAIGDGGKAEANSTANTVTDAVTSGLQNEENTTKFFNAGVFGAKKVLEGGKSLNNDLQNLGSGWAAYSNEGLKQKFEELQKSSTPGIMRNFAKVGITDPFQIAMGIHSPSTVFAGFGGFIVQGLNDGIKNNQDSSRGVISTWVGNIKNWFTDLLDIHSPSQLFAKFGGFTVAGFNVGLSDNMESSESLIALWADNVSKAFDIANIVAPDVGTTYSVNRQFFDMVDTKASVSYDVPSYDFKAGVSAELNAALSGIFDYEKMANTIAPIVARALENADIKAQIGDQEVWSSTKNNWNKEYSRNKKAPVPV
ncbi:methyl-accepting chemotaxis protein [Lacrimispora sp.]|uniref:methyl-accepting chemotaxis protein n=1 Tax=Lacrimispora sp. TaxID=2719234 RepID=UPI003996BAF3